MIRNIFLLFVSLYFGFFDLKGAYAQGFYNEPISESLLEEMREKWKPLEVKGDAIPWDVFASTKELESCSEEDEEGFYSCFIKPEYGKKIKKFDGKKVTLMGYMFPLEHSDKHKNFLIGPYPLSCPFHYHVGPSQIIEVVAAKTIDFSYEPITIKGILKLSFNEETGVFYYLENAAP